MKKDTTLPKQTEEATTQQSKESFNSLVKAIRKKSAETTITKLGILLGLDLEVLKNYMQDKVPNSNEGAYKKAMDTLKEIKEEINKDNSIDEIIKKRKEPQKIYTYLMRQIPEETTQRTRATLLGTHDSLISKFNDEKKIVVNENFQNILERLEDLVQRISNGTSIPEILKEMEGKSYNIWDFAKLFSYKNSSTFNIYSIISAILSLTVAAVVIVIITALQLSPLEITGNNANSVIYFTFGVSIITSALALSFFIKVHIQKREYFTSIRNILIAWGSFWILWSAFFFMAGLISIDINNNTIFTNPACQHIILLGISFILYYIFSQLHYEKQENKKKTFISIILISFLILSILAIATSHMESAQNSYIVFFIKFFISLSFFLLAGKLIEKEIRLFGISIFTFAFAFYLTQFYPGLDWQNSIPIVVLLIIIGIGLTVKFIQGDTLETYLEQIKL